MNTCGCNAVPVDYHRGYPPHQELKQPRVSKDLVMRGYQDHPSDEVMVSLLGRQDAHKKGSFHPAHHSPQCQYQFKVGPNKYYN